MPTYQYRCDTCGEDFDVYQSFSEDSLTVCPLVHGPEGTDACGGAVKKVFGNIAVTFKGSGFYKTDSRGSKKSNGATTSDSSSSTDSKSSDTSSGDKTSTDSKSDKTSTSSTSSSDSTSSKNSGGDSSSSKSGSDSKASSSGSSKSGSSNSRD